MDEAIVAESEWFCFAYEISKRAGIGKQIVRVRVPGGAANLPRRKCARKYANVLLQTKCGNGFPSARVQGRRSFKQEAPVRFRSGIPKKFCCTYPSAMATNIPVAQWISARDYESRG